MNDKPGGTQIEIMEAILDKPRLSAYAIARFLSKSSSQVSVALKSLARRGYIEWPDGHPPKLTPSGRKYILNHQKNDPTHLDIL